MNLNGENFDVMFLAASNNLQKLIPDTSTRIVSAGVVCDDIESLADIECSSQLAGSKALLWILQLCPDSGIARLIPSLRFSVLFGSDIDFLWFFLHFCMHLSCLPLNWETSPHAQWNAHSY